MSSRHGGVAAGQPSLRSRAAIWAGFGGVRRSQPGDSVEPLFMEVESPGRFVDAGALECARPR